MRINDEFTPPTIVDYDYYVSQYILPVTDNVAGQKDLIDRWIIQCQDQIDVLCGGRVYDEFPNLDLTKEKDKRRAYYLRKAICSLLEYYIDTGKAFVDKNFSSSSNVPANINASSEDANFEHKRKDIIKLLTQGNWYQTFNSYTNALDCQNWQTLQHDFDFTNLVDRLGEIFKRLDNKNSFNTNQVMNNYNLTNIKELVGYNINTSYLRNFKLGNSVDVSEVISVSKDGESIDKVNFITINGKEYQIGGSGGSSLVTNIKQNGVSILNFETGVADIDAYKKADAQTKVYYGTTAPENPKDNDIWVEGSTPIQAAKHLYAHHIEIMSKTPEGTTCYLTIYNTSENTLDYDGVANYVAGGLEVTATGIYYDNTDHWNIFGLSPSGKITFHAYKITAPNEEDIFDLEKDNSEVNDYIQQVF